MTQARTLGELKKSGLTAVPVKEEMRRNTYDEASRTLTIGNERSVATLGEVLTDDAFARIRGGRLRRSSRGPRAR